MKELSIEEKARRYDEAIKRAKAMIPVAANQEEIYNSVITIFPELAESEDERIKKALLNFLNKELKYHGDVHWDYEVLTTEIVSWLNKIEVNTNCNESKQDICVNDPVISFVNVQGEQKSADKVEPKQKWSNEDERIYQSIMDDTVQENQLDDKQTIWLKSIRPRSQWKPSKEQIMALRWVLSNVPYNMQKEEIRGLLDQIKDL